MTVAYRAAARFLESDLFRKGDRDQRRIGLAAYRMLAAGRPLTVERLAEVVGAEPAAVRAAVRATSRSAVQWDAAGHIVGYGGLTLEPTRHRLTVGDRTLYTWCAFDCLFVPELLAEPADVTSACSTTGDEIRLSVSPERVERIDPHETVISFVTPGTARCEADIRGAFCRHVNFFRSATATAAADWPAGQPDMLVLSVAEAFELGRLRNRVAFADALVSGTAEE